MKIFILTTTLLFTLGFSGSVLAHSTGKTDWYGKEGQDSEPSYMERAICKLPKDDAEQFRDTMKDARENNAELQQQVIALHSQLHALLTADTFDKDAFIAKRREVQQLHDQMENNMAVAFASAVDDLSKEERVTLSRSLEHEHAKHQKHKKMHKHAKNNEPSQPKPHIADTEPTDAGK